MNACYLILKRVNTIFLRPIFNLLSDYDVGKQPDFTHVKRGFGGDLYKARSQIPAGSKTLLSNAVISYLQKCIAYALYQNKDHEKRLKQSLEVMVPHAFGDHAKCSLQWCGKLKSPSGHKHVGLPDGHDLQGTALKKCLTDVI